MYYLAYYGDAKSEEKRANYPAATTKVNYIADILADAVDEVVILSPSMTTKKKTFFGGDTIKISKNIFLKYFPSYGFCSALGRKLMKIFTDLSILLFLKKNCKQNQPVIIYHSLSLLHMVFAIKLFTKAKVILEVEEIYQDVVKTSKLKAKWEYKAFEKADGYIFSTKSLNDIVNSQNKPYMVINGVYNVEAKRNVAFTDNKIHCIYAGTLEPSKGSLAAIKAAAFLPENYVVHILGFGTEAQIEQVKQLIDQTQQTAECTIAYEGLMSGEEYIKFLQKCHIGLCTQIPDQKYANTSFPSKVLVYMANGLRVLSVNIPAVRNSGVGEFLWYYDVQSPEKIAEAIRNINIEQPYDAQECLKKLDQKCRKELEKILLHYN